MGPAPSMPSKESVDELEEHEQHAFELPPELADPAARYIVMMIDDGQHPEGRADHVAGYSMSLRA